MELYTVDVHYNAPNGSLDATGQFVCTYEPNTTRLEKNTPRLSALETYNQISL